MTAVRACHVIRWDKRLASCGTKEILLNVARVCPWSLGSKFASRVILGSEVSTVANEGGSAGDIRVSYWA
jgi:hypothetical protein